MDFRIFYHFGRFVMLMKSVFSRPPGKFSMYWKEILRQMVDIGVGSLVVVVLIAIFIGAVTAIQFAYQLDGGLVPRYYIGYIVRDLAIIESAPTITCLVLAGKVGSNIAAEIGGMRQKEHIDAMELMGVNTASYLIMPRIIAAMVVIPLLVTIAAYVAIVGGWMATVLPEKLTNEEYVRGLRSFFVPFNIVLMYVKAVTFAFILSAVPSFQGYFVRGGAIELGAASTNAVVFSDILILLADYVIAVILTT
jgi:phospholipid/cholesterol/gamma-HCH transport system permease protein